MFARSKLAQRRLLTAVLCCTALFACIERAVADPASAAMLPFPLPASDQLDRAASLKLLDAKPRTPPTREQLLARLDAFSKAAPAAEYDLAAGAAAMKPGLEAAFHFVRDRIAYESYPGVLRGPGVTYSSRAGNAFDRSLLLAALLERQKIKIRFARGKLAQADAELLFGRIFEGTPLASRLHADGLAAQRGRADSLLARIQNRANRDYAVVRSALGSSLPGEMTPPRSQVLDEIRDHVWVQALVDGKWVDLDASFADAEIGTARCAADKVVEKLSREDFQLVTLRVVQERLEGDKVKLETVFELTWPAVLLLDREILLIHAPGVASGLAGAIADPLLDEAWRPVLLIDGQPFFGKPVEFGASGAAAQRGQPPRGGLGGVFGRGGALSSGAAFIAEWLELEVVTPPGARELTRRALVDRAGLAWRQAAKPEVNRLRPLARDKQGITAPRTVHNLWLTAGRHNLASYAQAARAMAAAPDEPSGARRPRSQVARRIRDSLWPLSMQNAACLVVSDELVVPSLNDAPNVRFYADKPRILLMSLGADPEGKSPDTCLSIDLLRDRLRGMARDRAAESSVAERKIWFGILEGALEHEILPLASGSDAKKARRTSTSGSLNPRDAIALRTGDADKIASQLRDANLAAAATRALDQKKVLVLAGRGGNAATAAWWEIAADGTTYAVLGQDEAHGSRTYFPPTSVPLGSTGGGAGRSVPGVIPRDPPDPFRGPHIPQPGGGPFPTDPGVEYAPGYGPGGRTGGTGAGNQGGAKGGGKGGDGEEGSGATEYVGIVKEQSVPNAFAVLEEFVDKFLVASSDVAIRVGTVLEDFFSLFAP